MSRVRPVFNLVENDWWHTKHQSALKIFDHVVSASASTSGRLSFTTTATGSRKLSTAQWRWQYAATRGRHEPIVIAATATAARRIVLVSTTTTRWCTVSNVVVLLFMHVYILTPRVL
jgi:hypothetical protein